MQHKKREIFPIRWRRIYGSYMLLTIDNSPCFLFAYFKYPAKYIFTMEHVEKKILSKLRVKIMRIHNII